MAHHSGNDLHSTHPPRRCLNHFMDATAGRFVLPFFSNAGERCKTGISKPGIRALDFRSAQPKTVNVQGG